MKEEQNKKISKPIVAHLNELRISPRKVRLVAGLIRGKSVVQARQQLNFLPKRSAEPILKLLNSAVANAKNNFKISESALFVEKIFVNQGRVLKRGLPRAFGRTSPIQKKNSRVTLMLNQR
jgi:large subunit ribosomal protein L22